MSKGLEALIMLTTGIITEEQAKEYRHIIEQELKEKDELAQALSIVTCENGDLLKYKKALEIIKENFMLVEKMYDTKLVIKIPLTQEEYNLLKEVLLCH